VNNLRKRRRRDADIRSAAAAAAHSSTRELNAETLLRVSRDAWRAPSTVAGAAAAYAPPASSPPYLASRRHDNVADTRRRLYRRRNSLSCSSSSEPPPLTVLFSFRSCGRFPFSFSSLNPNPTTKQHAIMNIQLNIVACLMYPDKFIRDNVVAPSVLVAIVIVTLPGATTLSRMNLSGYGGCD